MSIILLTICFIIECSFADIESGYIPYGDEDFIRINKEISFLYGLKNEGEPNLVTVSEYMSHIFFSEIPVYIMDPLDFLHFYLGPAGSEHCGNISSLYGLFVFKGDRLGLPKYFIYIRDSDWEDMISVFFHETKHYMCRMNGCFCGVSAWFNELHAYEYEIEILLKNGYDDALVHDLIELARFFVDEPRDPVRDSVINYISKQELWRTCITKLENKWRMNDYR